MSAIFSLRVATALPGLYAMNTRFVAIICFISVIFRFDYAMPLHTLDFRCCRYFAAFFAAPPPLRLFQILRCRASVIVATRC